MWSLYRLLRLLWYVVVTVLVGGTAVGVLGNCRFSSLSLQDCAQRLLGDLQDPFLIAIVITLLTLGALFFFAASAQRRRTVSKKFELLKPASELRPEDLGFRVVEAEAEEEDPIEHSHRAQRPFYESAYVPRLAVCYRQRNHQHPEPWCDEEDLAEALRQSESFVLIGAPEDGKTRTLYEIVRQMNAYEVLVPKVDKEEIPEKADLYFLFKGKRIILLLDDLYAYKNHEKALITLGKKLSECDVSWTIASTCQNGAEWVTVQSELGRLRASYISHELWLVSATPKRKRQLAESNRNEPLDPDSSDDYPTLGSIAMETQMNAMRTRFNILSYSHPEQADVLRGLKLLDCAGLPLTHELLRAVLRHEKLFQYRDPHFLPQSLGALADQEGFLRRGGTDPVRPEPAYLRDCVTYLPGRTPEEDFPLLADMLEELEDPEGLRSLGITCRDKLKAQEWAIAYFDRALRLRPNDPDTLRGKGNALIFLGRYEDALEAYDEALRLNPDDPRLPYNEAIALHTLGRFEDALAAYDAALDLRPTFPEALHNKGRVLHDLGRYEDALAAYDGALDLRPDFSDALNRKGVTLDDLGRYLEALAAYDEALRLDPNFPEAFNNKGITHRKMNDYEGALHAFDESIRLRPSYPVPFYNKGLALKKLGRYEDAVEAYNESLRRRPNHPDTLDAKGDALRELGRHEEAAEAYKAARYYRAREGDEG
jgi:tetratricopeptide (TPR) repeat protein